MKIYPSNTIEELQKIILSQQQTIDQQKLEIVAHKDRYVRLLEEFKLARSRHFSSSSEKNILQLDLFDEAGAELPEETQDEINDEINIKNDTPKKPRSRRVIPKDLPREIVLHDIAESEKICECGAHLIRIGEEVTEQVKYIPATLSVIQHVRPKYACKPCQENIKIAPMPNLLLPKCIAAPELIAYTLIAKYCDHIPLYRQEAIWSRLGIEMPRSSLCAWVLKVAELCEPLVTLLQRHIITYDYVQVDETTVQVLEEKERENKTKSYMWAYRGGGDKTCIVFEYQPTRSGYHAAKFLAGFKGYLQSDAYSGYHFADKDMNITRAGCMAHARRKFADIVKLAKSKGLAHEAINHFRGLYKIENDAKGNKLSSEARYVLRQQKSLSLINSFKKWLDINLTKTSEQSKIGVAIRYALSNWEALTQYLKDGRIEIDNNNIENAIRPFALGRKNWLFMGSPKGAKAGAIIYSLIETCKVNQVEPYQYFCKMLNHIRECRTNNDYYKLLPQFIEF